MLEQSRSRFSISVEPVDPPALIPGSANGRRRRSATKGGLARRWGVLLAACAAASLCALAFAFAVTRPARADATSARVELGQSVGLLKLGNISAARAHAQAAIKADPDWGLAHAVLARIFLALATGSRLKANSAAPAPPASTPSARISSTPMPGCSRATPSAPWPRR